MPYPLLLGIFVAVLDLVPVVGSTIAGVVVAAVALTISLPVCIATIVFFVVFRLLEDYLLVPRIIGRAVNVPALITVIAVLVGGALLWDCRCAGGHSDRSGSAAADAKSFGVEHVERDTRGALAT